jgi:hypothetical protein
MNAKVFYTSKGAMGAIASVVAGGITLVLQLDPQQSQAVLEQSTAVVGVVLQVITIGGSILALYGRIKATQPLSLTAPKPPTTT